MVITRDLEWVLSSPGLLIADAEPGIQPAKCLLHDLRQDSLRHMADLITPPYRLGSYYEELVNIILKSSPYIYDIKRNIILEEAGITRGEFDFLGCYTDQPFHLECAIKFYLRVNSGTELKHFIGPGKADRLDKKAARLFEHQLRLADTAAGQQLTRQLSLIPKLRLLQLQGYLFHPWDEGCPTDLHPLINPAHLTGWWLHQHRLNQLRQDNTELMYVPMRKPYWLSVNAEQVLDYGQLQAWLTTQTRPVLLSRGRISNRQWQEVDRGFVVPEDW